MRNNKIKQMTIASMLCAIGIIIPMFSPIKIIIEPASFTLGSHIPIMIAMFLSPAITLAVCVGTTIGFFFGGFPITIVLRAASHIIFALIGSYWLSKNKNLLYDRKSMVLFFFILSLIHAICEVLIVTPFFFSNPASSNYMYTILGLVGIGTVIHSMVDFTLSRIIYQLLFSNEKRSSN